MPDDAVLCRNFTNLRDAQKSMGDQFQTLIDELISQLEDLLVGPYLDALRDGLAGATTPSEKLAAVRAAYQKLLRDILRLLNALAGASGAGAPTDPWPVRALPLYDRLIMLLRGLIVLRDLESAFDGFVREWCD